MSVPNEIAGLAALSICESLLLALSEHKVLPEAEIIGILEDAAAAHETVPDTEDAQIHTEVAALINGIMTGGTALRRR